MKNKDNTIERTYRVSENVITLIIGVETTAEQSNTLPIEYKKRYAF